MTYVAQTWRVETPKCAKHPGVKWNGAKPCFVCEPDEWRDAQGGYVPTSSGHVEDVATCVAEMMAARASE